MAAHQPAFTGFANPVDPTADELRGWAYAPQTVPAETLPTDWDLLLAGETLVGTLFELALDPGCPARRFALHCLHIYAGDAIRTGFRSHSRRRLRRLIERAAAEGDEALRLWAANCRALLERPELFDYPDWCEGGLVRQPRRIS
jgi:hypothetical protein